MASYRSFSEGFVNWSSGPGALDVTMTEPSGTAPGDTLVVLIWSSHGLGTPTVTLPSGWTLLRDGIDGNATPRVTIGWVRRGASAPSLTFTVDRPSDWGGSATWHIIAVQSGGTVGLVSTGGLMNFSTHTAPGVTVPFGSSLLISWIGGGAISSVPSGMTQVGSTPIAYQSVGAGATGDRTWTLSWSQYTRAGLFVVHDAPSVTGLAVVYPSGATRTGPNATPWQLQATIAAINRVQVRTAADGGGTLVNESAVTPTSMNLSIAYNASGLVEGSQTLHLRISQDGGTTWFDQSTFTLRRDDSVSAPTGVTPSGPTPMSTTYSVAFNAPDTYSTDTNEMLWQVRTASGGGGTLIAQAAFTQGNGRNTGSTTDSALVNGSNTRWLRIRDGALNWAETSFTVSADFVPRPDYEEWRAPLRRRARASAARRRSAVRMAAQVMAEVPYRMVLVQPELQWRVGGVVELVRELLWRAGGRRSLEINLRWRSYPSEQAIEAALRADRGSVAYGYRAAIVEPSGVRHDITSGVIAAVVEFNINRAVKRSLRLTINPRLCGDVEFARLGDVVELEFIVNVGGFEVAYPMGRFLMEVPDIQRQPDSQVWTMAGADETIRLAESAAPEPHTVAAGSNIVAAVASILDDHGLTYVLPQSAATLGAARTWPAGTPWLTIANDLLEAAGLRTLWAGADGVIRSDRLELLAERTPDVTYDERWIVPPTRVQYSLARTANRIIVVSSNPAAAQVSASATNDNPDSPIAVSRIGRVIAKVVQADVTTQAAADERAAYELQLAAAYYQTMEMETLVDPRRDGPEVYEVLIPCRDSRGRWALQSWVIDIGNATRMVHNLGRVQRI